MNTPNLNRLVSLIVLTASLFVADAFGQSKAERAQAEWDRLHDMQQTLSPPEYVGRNVEADLTAIANLQKFREHFDEVAQAYAAEIKSDEQPFRNLGFGLTHVREHLANFEKAAKEYGSLVAIQEDLEHVMRMTQMAVENQAPAFFQPENDICRRTKLAQTRLRYLETINPNSADLKQAQQLMDSTAAFVKKTQTALAQDILAQNELPPDEYRNPDRESLIKLIDERWAAEGNRAKILKIGIVSTDWTRGVAWEIQNRTLYKTDKSRIQGYVLVAHSEDIAVRHSINLTKDHLANDRVTGAFLNDPQAEPELQNQILRSKLK